MSPTSRKPSGTPRTTRGAARFALPFTTVDVVIFTVLDSALQVLLVQRPRTAIRPRRPTATRRPR